MRINKLLSSIGYCSRRAADKLVEEGRVTVDGKMVEMGEQVDENAISVWTESLFKKKRKTF